MPASRFVDTLAIGGTNHAFASLPKISQQWSIAHLPFSLKILLENLVRHHDGENITDHHLEALATWDPATPSQQEIDFMPARVVLQDFTGVPCVVDLAAMRDAVVALGGKPEHINPQIPSELVIDHSVQVDAFGRADALDINNRLEFERNAETSLRATIGGTRCPCRTARPGARRPLTRPSGKASSFRWG